MIRVDLGRNKDERKPSLVSRLSVKFPAAERFGKLGANAGNLATLGIAGAIALLPPLFVGEYAKVITKRMQEQIKEIQAHTSKVEGEIAALQPFKQELDNFEAQKTMVKDRIAVIRALESNRGTPVNVLDAVGQSLPQHSWINDLEFYGNPILPSAPVPTSTPVAVASAPPAAGASARAPAGTPPVTPPAVVHPGVSNAPSPQISLNGQSLSNEDIADFIDKLSESVFLTDVALDDVTSGVFESVEVKSFRVMAKPKPRIASQ